MFKSRSLSRVWATTFCCLSLQCGYRILLQASFMPALAAAEAAGKLPAGALAVLYDKNKMEAGGYAAALADLTGEQVILMHMLVYVNSSTIPSNARVKSSTGWQCHRWPGKTGDGKEGRSQAVYALVHSMRSHVPMMDV